MDTSNSVVKAHQHSSIHRQELLSSKEGGCFYCLFIITPTEIIRWCDNEQTAICPKCGIDSVIGSASNYPIDKTFLLEMKKYWF